MITYKLLPSASPQHPSNKGAGLWTNSRAISVDLGQNPALLLRSPDGSLGAVISSNEDANAYPRHIAEFLERALKKFSMEGFGPEAVEAAMVGGADNAKWRWDRMEKIIVKAGLDFRKFDATGLYYREVHFEPKSGAANVFRKEANPQDWNPASAKLSLESGTKGFSEGHAGGVVANATRFFRERSTFAALRELIVPEHLAQTPEEPLLIWSAACSTGAEAYSYAMYVHRLLARAGARCPFKIFATDINQRLIQSAKIGRYKVNKSDVVEFRAYFEQYGTLKDDVLQFGKDIQRFVSFGAFDLKRVPRRKGFRMVVCANVFQYYDDDARTHFLENFKSAVSRPGYIYVGPVKNQMADALGLVKLTKYKLLLAR